MTTVVYWQGGRVHTQSDAVMRVFSQLQGGWRIMRLLAVIPKPVRDALYEAVSSRRYRIFGRHDACRIATPDEQRFILD
jgi:predicted DCC family thiol-disulfide oxidoreductase YuxK